MGRPQECAACTNPAWVTDLVNADSSEAQGNLQLFQNNTSRVIRNLIGDLPKWLAEFRVLS